MRASIVARVLSLFVKKHLHFNHIINSTFTLQRNSLRDFTLSSTFWTSRGHPGVLSFPPRYLHFHSYRAKGSQFFPLLSFFMMLIDLHRISQTHALSHFWPVELQGNERLVILEPTISTSIVTRLTSTKPGTFLLLFIIFFSSFFIYPPRRMGKDKA